MQLHLREPQTYEQFFQNNINELLIDFSVNNRVQFMKFVRKNYNKYHKECENIMKKELAEEIARELGGKQK